MAKKQGFIVNENGISLRIDAAVGEQTPDIFVNVRVLPSAEGKEQTEGAVSEAIWNVLNRAFEKLPPQYTSERINLQQPLNDALTNTPHLIVRVPYEAPDGANISVLKKYAALPEAFMDAIGGEKMDYQQAVDTAMTNDPSSVAGAPPIAAQSTAVGALNNSWQLLHELQALQAKRPSTAMARMWRPGQ